MDLGDSVQVIIRAREFDCLFGIRTVFGGPWDFVCSCARKTLAGMKTHSGSRFRKEMPTRYFADMSDSQ